jgi:hypothetical protein
MFPDLYTDDHPLRDDLRAAGIEVDVLTWDDPRADWAAYDLVVIRSPWDYPARRDEFVAWASRVPRLLNPADIIAWNTDKHYLRELAAVGIPVTPTDFIEPFSSAPGSGPAGSGPAGSGPAGSGPAGSGPAVPGPAVPGPAVPGSPGSGPSDPGSSGSESLGSGSSWSAPESGEWVVKPAISAGSRDTGRYAFPAERDLALAHVARLTDAGRAAMIQPYLHAVDTAGETAVLCTPDANGKLSFSHAIRKGPMLTGPDVGQIDLASLEKIDPRTPTDAELSLAARVLETIPGGTDRLLYARVDMIPGPDGTPMLVELELAEPSLFLSHAPHATARLSAAIQARL